jgi:hypothetical protein
VRRREEAARSQAPGVPPPGEQHPVHSVGTFRIADDPTGHSQHKDGEENQGGERRLAELSEQSSGQHPYHCLARVFEGAFHGFALLRCGERSAKPIEGALRS